MSGIDYLQAKWFRSCLVTVRIGVENFVNFGSIFGLRANPPHPHSKIYQAHPSFP